MNLLKKIIIIDDLSANLIYSYILFIRNVFNCRPLMNIINFKIFILDFFSSIYPSDFLLKLLYFSILL